MLDIHGKCRREREELKAKLAEYDNAINWYTSCLNCSALLDRCYSSEAVVEAAKAWRELVRTRGTVYALDSRAADLIAAVDALAATEPRLDLPSPVAASGRTSNEDGADVGATANSHVAPTNSQTWEQEMPACTCPEVWAGTHRTGGRNLSPGCPRHGEGTQYWRDFWTAQAALGSPRERAERLHAERTTADSRAGQAGEEVA